MKSRQRGQAMPLGIALILFGILGGLVLYNTGQTATDKTRLANAADAAAYSGVLWQARALNFQSYTNRAMVANQVTIGQAVSLQSWTRYARITAENIELVTSWIPWLNAVTAAVSNASAQLDRFLIPIGDAMVSVVDGVNRGLSVSQDAMFASSFAATPDIVRNNASASDERFSADTGYTVAGMARSLTDWSTFTDRYSPADQEDRDAIRARTLLIGESTDRFTRQRNWRLFSPRLYTSPFTSHQVIREGETRLLEVEGSNGELQYEWKAKDTVQLENKFDFLIGSKTVDVPIGWGEAFANENGENSIEENGGCRQYRIWKDHHYTSCGSRWFDKNSEAEKLADIGRNFKGTDPQVKTRGYTGIQAFRSLSDATLEYRDPRLMLRVEVAMDSADVADSNKSVSGERFQAPMVTPGDRLSSISIAEVYYQRPDSVLTEARSRTRDVEYANGYNPYWDVRLSSIPERERLLALSLRPGGLSNSVPTGLQLTDAGSELGSYVESDPEADAGHTLDSSLNAFADSYGVSDAESLELESNSLAGRGPGELDSMLAGLDVDVMSVDEITDSVKGELTDVLKDSVSNILSRISGSGAGTRVQETLDGIEAEADELGELVPKELDSLAEFSDSDVFKEAQAKSERMKALHKEASERFEPIATEAIAEVDVLRQPLLDQLERSGVDKDEVRRLRYQIHLLNEGLVVELANELRGTMDSLGIEWDQGYKQTRHIVRELLDDYYNDPASGVNWELPADELDQLLDEADATEDEQ